MGSTVIVEVDPISDCSCCVLKAFEAMPMDALLVEGSDYAFNHSVLLLTVWGYELLFQSITANETGVVAAGKDEAIIGS